MQADQFRAGPSVPIVVQVGFAGSRQLFDPSQAAGGDGPRLHDELLAGLATRLAALPALLGLGERHALCGVSQVAAGADLVFSQACRALGIPQRVLLPQPLEAYLAATDGGGRPDFTPQERDAARSVVASPHVIEETVVDGAGDRLERFEEANLQILRDADVVLCLLRADAAPGRAGGTRDLIDRAVAAGKPVLAMTFAVRDGHVVLDTAPPVAQWPNGAGFRPPGLPHELAALPGPPPDGSRLPPLGPYLDAVRQFASAQTRRHSGLFKRAAISIIALHIAATVLAILAWKLTSAPWVMGLLAAEVLLLLAGLHTHRLLHRSAGARIWAVTRLLAETLRSLKSASATGVALDYPRALPMPDAFAPLLRTAAVLQAARQRGVVHADWPARRDRYVDERIDGHGGQLPYFRSAAAGAARWLRVATVSFWAFSLGAVAATLAKLAALLGAPLGALAQPVGDWAGLFAIALPVVAVGSLSWAASSDLEARAKTYADMQRFLAQQAAQLRRAGTRGEFLRLVRETELRILGENLAWYARRLFTSVA